MHHASCITDDGGTGQKPETIPEYSAKEEMEDKKNWRRVMIAGKEHAVDMRAINPYKKVLSHGGMYTMTSSQWHSTITSIKQS